MYKAAQNNDRELWREVEGDHYADSIHVTENGNIGIDVGGNVIVMPVEEWHKLASELIGSEKPSTNTERAK